MEKTGQTFDMNAETFTLENIFAMELHRFQDKIGEIVNCAIKELAIEKVFFIQSFVLEAIVWLGWLGGVVVRASDS